MDNKSLDQWWAGLTIAQKERIASKAASKRSGNPEQVLYPECTRWNRRNGCMPIAPTSMVSCWRNGVRARPTAIEAGVVVLFLHDVKWFFDF